MKNFGLDLTALKINLSNYFERLSAVRKTGDWEGRLEFFLTGVVETGQPASTLLAEDMVKIKTLKSAAINARQVHRYLRRKAIINPVGP